jgi:tRNA threonylcarbamoyl adenosine modification protein (Sua5/YciO/YrdC/YwlC family)
LEDGGVVIFSPDTVYGFWPYWKIRRRQIKFIKSKPSKIKATGRVRKRPENGKSFIKNFPEQENILKKKWPGKYTFILNSVIGKKTIALRVPKYKPLNNLLQKINKPLAQTSVNISGRPELNKIKDIKEKFEESGILIFDAGNLPKRKPSAIIDLTKNEITKIR